ncbi:unnamed protein product [marine sediment metagenome]|uniref:Uncharacterized protein n=1 Tax=marine sediment metagenome TaxID=412755 RepID=X1LJE4_9ZZZZ
MSDDLKPIGNILNDVIKKIPPKPNNESNNKPTNTNDDDNNKIQFKQKKCKFSRDLIEYPISKNWLTSTITTDKGKTYMDKEFKTSSEYDYMVRTLLPFNKNITLFDSKVLLVISYLADFFTKKSGYYEDKHRFITVSFLDFIELLGVKHTGHYKKALIDTLNYYTNTTHYTPYIWDCDNKKRSNEIPLTDEGKIDYSKLKDFSVWHIINAYHFKNPDDLQGKSKKRCYNPRIEIELSREFYYSFLKYYTLIDFKKTVSLKNPTSLNLYLFLKNNWGVKFYKYSIGFEKLKKAIDITDTNESRAKDTFKTAWNKLKEQGLLSNYSKEQVLLSYLDYDFKPSKTGKEKIDFKLIKVSRA